VSETGRWGDGGGELGSGGEDTATDRLGELGGID